MATQIQKPIPLDKATPGRGDVGRGARFWTFINRSSYYVFVRMDWSESALDSDPDHVLEPYTTQRVDFPKAKDKVCWKPAADFPRSTNPTNAPDLFGFMASDSTSSAYPASVLNVGLTEAPTPILQASTAVLSSIENIDNPAGSIIVRAKQKDAANAQILLDNQGEMFLGNGAAPPTRFVRQLGNIRQLENDGADALLAITSEGTPYIAKNCYYDGVDWRRYNNANGGILISVGTPRGRLQSRTFSNGIGPITFNPAEETAFTSDIPAPTSGSVEELAYVLQSKQLRAPGGSSGLAMLSGEANYYLLINAYWDGTDFRRYDTTRGGTLMRAFGDTIRVQTFAAGANPITVASTHDLATEPAVDGKIAAAPYLTRAQVDDRVTAHTPWFENTALQTNWTGGVLYRKLSTGQIIVRGVVTSPAGGWTAGTVLFVMPPGYRPGGTLGFVVLSGTNNGQLALRVGATGNVVAPVSSNAQHQFFLNAITYMAEN